MGGQAGFTTLATADWKVIVGKVHVTATVYPQTQQAQVTANDGSESGIVVNILEGRRFQQMYGLLLCAMFW